MVEFLLGLVGIIFLIAGLMQVRELSLNSMKMNLSMRADLAGDLAADESFERGEFVYSAGNESGVDKRMFTADDKMIVSSASSFFTEFLASSGYNVPGTMGTTTIQDYLEQYSHNSVEDPYQRLESGSGDFAADLGMFYSSDTEDVAVVPVMRRLMGKNTIKLERGIWMPRLTGLIEEGP